MVPNQSSHVAESVGILVVRLQLGNDVPGRACVQRLRRWAALVSRPLQEVRVPLEADRAVFPLHGRNKGQVAPQGQARGQGQR